MGKRYVLKLYGETQQEAYKYLEFNGYKGIRYIKEEEGNYIFTCRKLGLPLRDVEISK